VSRRAPAMSGTPIDVPVMSLTATFMRCAECFRAPKAPGISPLWPPRGWAGQSELRAPTVVVVSQNPGHPLRLPRIHGPGWDETALLKSHGLLLGADVEGPHVAARRSSQATRAAARDVLGICWRSYVEPTRSRDHLFHRRSVAYARACLWLLGVDGDWKDHCWFTDVVKCSTTTEAKARLPARAIENCRSHLVSEIMAVRPSVVAVLGRAAFCPTIRALAEAGSRATPIQLLHPARWHRLTSERQLNAFSGFPAADGRSPTSPAFRKLLNSLQGELRVAPGRPALP
jgi:hypothetical protein